MNLLHRHIFMNVLLTCAASVSMFGFLIMIGSALKELLPYLLSGQMELFDFIRLSGMTIPYIAYYAMPPGILTGVLLVLGRMSSDREITAMRAAGLNVAWLSAPIIFLALLGVIAALMINFHFMPVARQAFLRERENVVRQNPLSFIVERTFIREFKGIVLYVGERQENRLKDFWVWELDDQNRVRRFARADAGRLDYDEGAYKLVLSLEQAQAEVRDEKDPEDFSRFAGSAAWEQASFDLSLDKAGGERVVPKKLKLLTFPQLMAEWAKLQQPPPEMTAADQARQKMRVQVTIQEKFATAFSVLSFALIAIPLGIKLSRKETSANLGLGLMLGLAYYFVSAMSGLLDNHPEWRPDLIVWLPNIIFQGIGLWLFYRVDRS